MRSHLALLVLLLHLVLLLFLLLLLLLFFILLVRVHIGTDVVAELVVELLIHGCSSPSVLPQSHT